MRKTAVIFALCLFVFPLMLVAQEQELEVAPLVLSTEGNTQASFIETRWPDFYQYIPANGCNALNKYSKKRKIQGVPSSLYPDVNGDGLFDYITDAENAAGDFQSYPNTTTIPAGYNVVYEYEPSSQDFVSIPGLSLTLNLADQDLTEYSQTARILVTWTVRLEGYKHVIQPNRSHTPWFGQSCGGTTLQAFPKGNAYTRLFVNGVPVGNPSIMTIPYGGEGSASGRVDPTHTGAAVLSPDMDMFENGFPNEMAFEIKIYNDTGMELRSPAGMRNLVLTITPLN